MTAKSFVLVKNIFAILSVSVFILMGLTQCKKDSLVNGTGISFSTDTLTFDTVFSSLGSSTRYFKIRNSTSKAITISNIKLMGLQGSQFRLAVDGVSGTNFNDVEVLANDSLYVFAEVTVNPNNTANPFVIQDEVVFSVKGQMQKVVLEAWGQNAYYHLGQRYSVSNPVPIWQTDKPHIILSKRGGYPGLSVDSGATLNIPSGTRIYMGAGALISVDGTLIAKANQGDSINFEGLRLEHYYDNRPGQWLGIIYGRPANVQLKGCIINESAFGVSDEHIINVIVNQRITTSKIADYGTTAKPKVTLDNCIIRNTAGTALTAIYTELKATNCLFHTAGGNVTGLFLGGDYQFTHCTMANVYGKYVDHKSECLVITDQIKDIDNAVYTGAALTSAFTNCVVYGSLQNEFAFVTAAPSSQIKFENCLLKTNVDSFAHVNSISCILNQAPEFRKPDEDDYTPDSNISPLVNSGKNAGILYDLRYQIRDVLPDIGALEWTP